MLLSHQKTGADARRVAYFSMEIALESALPTYSGGLGVLAGDTLRAAADLGLPVCAVTLLYRKGYFRQHLDKEGRQSESPVSWQPEAHLEPLAAKVAVELDGKMVQLRAWRYVIKGATGRTVPVYFLDAALPENAPEHQALSDSLYGGDERYRLGQETLLGLGGVAMLTALGHPPAADDASPGIDVYHMNEGHAALLTIALLAGRDQAYVRRRCVFTTHTPVPAGHDTFPTPLVESMLGPQRMAALKALNAFDAGRLNMSHLAINGSRFVNGVAKRHGEVSRQMFPGTAVSAITNGVHAESWTADAMRTLFDRHLPGWRADNANLRYACEIPLKELVAAHREAKLALFAEIQRRTGERLSPDAFTIGFARRAAEYKRADLLFHDPEALSRAASGRPLQVVYAGKAHPKDFGGKDLIAKVHAGAAKVAKAGVKVVYLENYDLELGRLITTGVDLWLNNPVKPLEASGTSGMKAALNGVPNLSTLDGWWVEGLIPGVTGWEIDDPAYAFGQAKDDGKQRDDAARSLYDRLANDILPLYHDKPEAFAKVMRDSITINGPFFNTHRMVLQYFVQAYSRGE